MNAARTLLALLVVNATSACAMSTSYTPKHDGRVKLAMDTGRLALTKDGETFTEEESFSTLVVCDSEAKRFAIEGEKEIRSGRNLLMIAGVLNALVGTAPIGMVLMSMGAKDYADGQAGLVDTINRHNDTKRCNRMLAQKENAR